MNLSLLPGRVSICRLSADAPVPDWAAGRFVSITRTQRELSVVCAEAFVPEDVPSSPGWRILQVAGVLDFSLIGILAALAQPLADAKVSIFAISTYETDQILVQEKDLPSAVAALAAVGHAVELP